MDASGRILPVTFFTPPPPPIEWRSPTVSALAVSAPALLLLSTCVTHILEAQVAPASLPRMVADVSVLLHNDPFELPHEDDPSDLMQVMRELEKVKRRLRESEKQLKQNEEEITQLKEKEEEQDRMITFLSPPRRVASPSASRSSTLGTPTRKKPKKQMKRRK